MTENKRFMLLYCSAPPKGPAFELRNFSESEESMILSVERAKSLHKALGDGLEMHRKNSLEAQIADMKERIIELERQLEK